jgi:hypothetical protein
VTYLVLFVVNATAILVTYALLRKFAQERAADHPYALRAKDLYIFRGAHRCSSS